MTASRRPSTTRTSSSAARPMPMRRASGRPPQLEALTATNQQVGAAIPPRRRRAAASMLFSRRPSSTAAGRGHDALITTPPSTRSGGSSTENGDDQNDDAGTVMVCAGRPSACSPLLILSRPWSRLDVSMGWSARRRRAFDARVHRRRGLRHQPDPRRLGFSRGCDHCVGGGEAMRGLQPRSDGAQPSGRVAHGLDDLLSEDAETGRYRCGRAKPSACPCGGRRRESRSPEAARPLRANR